MSYYMMHRGWMESGVFRDEPHNMRSAWAWLIENAAWEPTQVRVERVPVPLERGELSCSEAFLAEKWKWPKSRVHRFLDDLATWGMISRRNSPTRKSERVANRPQSIITICNYNKYQSTAQIIELRREPTLNRVRTESEPIKKEGNTGKKEDRGSPPPYISPPHPKPARRSRLPADFQPPDEWIEAAVQKRVEHNLPPADTGLEWELFFNWSQQGSGNAVKSDWKRAWINWFLKAKPTGDLWNGAGQRFLPGRGKQGSFDRAIEDARRAVASGNRDQASARRSFAGD